MPRAAFFSITKARAAAKRSAWTSAAPQPSRRAASSGCGVRIVASPRAARTRACARKPVSRAIESLAHRLGIEEAVTFATLLQQSEELGSSITQSLRAYSDDMRNKRLMKAEEKAYALPAKLVIPLTLFIFPVLLIVLILPVAISVSGMNS